MLIKKNLTFNLLSSGYIPDYKKLNFNIKTLRKSILINSVANLI